MKGQIWNCKSIAWIAGGRKTSRRNCLVLFICFEQADTTETVYEAVRRITQLNQKRFQKTSVAVFPFAHFSSSVLPKQHARKFLRLIEKELTVQFNVSILPFNREKEVILHLNPKNEDVSFFEYH